MKRKAVTPLFKGDHANYGTTDPNPYYPVSAKYFFKLNKKQLVHHLQTHYNTCHSVQSGFRTGDGCIGASTKVLNLCHWQYKKMEGVFVDYRPKHLCQAHSCLFLFRSHCCGWVLSFLSQASLGNGVPQRSIRVPTSVNICVNKTGIVDPILTETVMIASWTQLTPPCALHCPRYKPASTEYYMPSLGSKCFISIRDGESPAKISSLDGSEVSLDGCYFNKITSRIVFYPNKSSLTHSGKQLLVKLNPLPSLDYGEITVSTSLPSALELRPLQ